MAACSPRADLVSWGELAAVELADVFLAQTIPELHLMLFSVLFSLFVLLCMDARPRPKKLRTDVQAAVQVLQSITSTCSHNALKEILSGLRDGGVDLDTVAPSMVRRAALARDEYSDRHAVGRLR